MSELKLEIANKWESPCLLTMKQWFNRIRQTFVLYKITDKILCASNPLYKSNLESVWFSILSYLREKGIAAPRTLDKDFLVFFELTIGYVMI